MTRRSKTRPVDSSYSTNSSTDSTRTKHHDPLDKHHPHNADERAFDSVDGMGRCT
jgi:hypothetical protein